VLKAFLSVKETYSTLFDEFDAEIFPNFKAFETLADISNLPFNEEIANKSYIMGVKFRATA
jgi:hypothetical protein